MRKFVLLFAALAILPAMAFAQFSAGPALFLKSPVLLGDSINVSASNVNQFSVGGDLRFRLGLFQAEGLMLFSLGEINSIHVFMDAGVAVDVAPFTLSLGAGPNFANNLGNTPLYQAGLNAKAGADINLGPVKVGMSYIMALNIFSGYAVITRYGLLGAHVLFSL